MTTTTDTRPSTGSPRLQGQDPAGDGASPESRPRSRRSPWFVLRRTVGELRESGHVHKTLRAEIRDNLLSALRDGRAMDAWREMIRAQDGDPDAALLAPLETHTVTADADGVVRVGITDFAQDALGDVVYVDLPEVGTEVTAGTAVGEVESTKSVSDIYAPVSGTVAAVNDELDGEPGLVNSAPYEGGWLFEITLADEAQLEGLMDAEGYASHTS